MEETRPLLVERRLDNLGGNDHENINANDTSEPAASEHSSSSSSNTTTTTTAVFLLTTFVAVIGSFVSGCAYSVFASIFTFGAMMGAIVSGKIADLIGRRGAIWLCDIFYTMGWLAILFAKGVCWLELGRLTMGFGVGIHTYVLMACGGITIMFFMGNVLTWRLLAIFGLVPCLVQSVGLFFIPESPRWLAKIGREKELEDSLQRLRGKNANIYSEMTEIRDYTKTFEQLSKTSILNLFERRYAHALTIGVGTMLLQQFGGNNGILFYASSIFEAAGCSVSVGTTAMAIIQIPFSALSVFLVDKFGRRPLLMVSAAGTCLGNILAGLGFLFQGFHYSTSSVVLCGVLVYFASFSAGMSATPFVLVSEIFPINIRGSAGSLAILANWLSSWIVSYSFNFLFDWSSPGTFVRGADPLLPNKLPPALT